MIASEDVARLAKGRWPQILASAGVDERVFDNKRQGFSCPGCGGSDRFSFYDTDGRGTYNCRAEGGGDGFKLLMHMNPRWTFVDAARYVREALGGVTMPLPRREIKSEAPARSLEQIRLRLQEVWDAGKPVAQGDVVDRYLRTRNLDLPESRATLRLHRGMKMWAKREGQEQPVLVGIFPVMLARFINPLGQVVGIHRTYLANNGNAKASSEYDCKQMMPGLGYSGSAIRLENVDRQTEMGVAEGIETGMACRVLFDVPVWPTGNRVLLEKVQLPEHIRKVHIFADNDSPDARGIRAGQSSANRLAARLRAEGRRAVIHLPARADVDFANMLQARLAKQRA